MQQLEEHFRPKPRPLLWPAANEVAAAVDLMWSTKRPLVISGRGARGAGAELCAFLDSLGAAYLDTGESKGLAPDDHPCMVAAMRGTVMCDADLVITVGRRLDFQLAYGSPAIFGAARFVRIGDAPGELRDNRRGAVELFARSAAALAAITHAARGRTTQVDRGWVSGLRKRRIEGASKLRDSMRKAPNGSDGGIHPNRVLGALQDQLSTDAIIIANGGDFLSFTRIGLPASTYLDPGSLGCIGIGTPFGVAASLAFPERQVVVATGDGAFGFNAMEIDTAVRHGAPVLNVVANNGARQIKVHDQNDSHGKVVGTRLQFADHAAMARAFGMYAKRVEKLEDLDGAVTRALARRRKRVRRMRKPAWPGCLIFSPSRRGTMRNETGAAGHRRTSNIGNPSNLTKYCRLLNNAITVVHRIGFGEISCKTNRDN